MEKEVWNEDELEGWQIDVLIEWLMENGRKCRASGESACNASDVDEVCSMLVNDIERMSESQRQAFEEAMGYC